jgi:general stress protein YciG
MAERKKNRAAVALAKLRAKSLTAEERSEIARKAGKASRAALTPEERSAVARKAGLAGGRGRKEKERRSEIARLAVEAREAKRRLREEEEKQAG